MSVQTGSVNRYARLLTRPGVASAVSGSLVARLPGAMLGLALVLAVTERRSPAAGGFAAAAVVVGMGLAGPLRGRLVDRIGARPVLIACGVGQALALAVLTGAVSAAAAWPVALGLAVLVGGLMPPIGPVMRTLWARLLDGQPDLAHAAQSWESVIIDVVYLLAPSLVAVLALTTGPLAALGVAAALTATGCVALAASRHMRDWPVAPPGSPRRSPVRSPGVKPLLLLGFLTTGTIAATELAAIRVSHDAGTPATAGWLIAALSLGSVAGGLAYGARRPRGSDRRHLAVCLVLWAVGHVGCVLLPSLVSVGVVLAITGLVLAPSITAEFALMARAAPPSMRTEAFGWLTSVGQAGAAAAAAVSGFLGHSGPFLLSAALAVAGIALLPWTRGRKQILDPATCYDV